MPKINVYLSDELATAVRTAGVPVSAVCQRALGEAVRTVGNAQRAIEAIRDPSVDLERYPQIGARVSARMTVRLGETITIARQAAGPDGRVETTHLLIGLLDEGHNLAVRLLQALNIEVDSLRMATARIDLDEAVVPSAGPVVADAAGPGCAEPLEAGSWWAGLTVPARAAIASALEASIDLGHNYLAASTCCSGWSTMTGVEPGASCAASMLTLRPCGEA